MWWGGGALIVRAFDGILQHPLIRLGALNCAKRRGLRAWGLGFRAWVVKFKALGLGFKRKVWGGGSGV